MDKKVHADISQESILGPLLSIFINNLSIGLQSNPKLPANNTSTIQDITRSTVSLNHDLTKISEWAVQWKMNFINPYPYEQAQELLESFLKREPLPRIRS